MPLPRTSSCISGKKQFISSLSSMRRSISRLPWLWIRPAAEMYVLLSGSQAANSRYFLIAQPDPEGKRVPANAGGDDEASAARWAFSMTWCLISLCRRIPRIFQYRCSIFAPFRELSFSNIMSLLCSFVSLSAGKGTKYVDSCPQMSYFLAAGRSAPFSTKNFQILVHLNDTGVRDHASSSPQA